MKGQAPRSRAVTDRPLTICEVAFVDEYLKAPDDPLGAAHRAGFTFRTRRSAELLRRRPAVQQVLATVTAKAMIKLELTAERVLEEMARLAFADIRGLFDKQGRLRRPGDWSAETAAAVANFQLVTTGAGEGDVAWVVQVRLVDKTKALDLLARHLAPLRGVAGTGKSGTPLGALSDDDLKARALALAVKGRRK